MGVVQSTGEVLAFPSPDGLSFTVTPGTAFTSGNRVVGSIVVYYSGLGEPDLTSIVTVTVNGVAGTVHLSATNNGDHFAGAIFSGVAGSGSAGVVVTFSQEVYDGGGIYMAVSCVECDDLGSVDSGSLFHFGGSGTSMAVNSGALSNSNERLFILGMTGNNDIRTITLQGGDTQVYADPDGAGSIPGAFAYRANTGTGAQSAVWTASGSTQWAMLIAGFPITGGGGGPVNVNLTGSSSAGSAGSFAPSVRAPLSGSSSSSSSGTLAARVRAALSGIASAGSVGSFGLRVRSALSGSASTASVGSFTPSVRISIAGSSSAASIGALGIKIAVPLAGSSCAGAVGAFSLGMSCNLSGVSSSGALGSFAPAVSVPMTGAASSGALGSFGLRISLTLSGSEAQGFTGLLIPPGTVTVELSGEVCTGTLGAFGVSIRAPVAGSVSTSDAGTLGVRVAASLAGSEAASAVGSFGLSSALRLTGSQAIGSVGTFSPAVSAALSGVVSTSSAGNFSVVVLVALQGSQSIGAAGSFVFEVPPITTPRLVSITFENVGSACSLTIVNAGSLGAIGFESEGIDCQSFDLIDID